MLVVVRAARRAPAERAARAGCSGASGCSIPGLAYALSLIGLTEITASLAVLLWATEPIFILALAALVLGERVGLAIVASSAVAIAGLRARRRSTRPPAARRSGIALTVAGVVVCAVYTVATRRWLLGIRLDVRRRPRPAAARARRSPLVVRRRVVAVAGQADAAGQL